MRASLQFLLFVFLTACSGLATADPPTQVAPPLKAGQAEAIFAGGCFWCMEGPFDKVDGVLSTASGYTGGPESGATYKQVSAGKTGHYEALRVVYDPSKVSYEKLLQTFWHNIDPTQSNGQFCDRGPHYRSAIFSSNPAETALAEESKNQIAAELKQEVVTEILSAGPFWLAEEYHQDFYKKNPSHYLRYRKGCGRDRRLEELWGTSTSH
ncbi:MAG: peptide-methionine (S)-S-oxide reductase MsrA [Myxococcota bacterium]|nr:peptide-methionine (S)-S-oxide reductase MsrA [Myxococcota bacterium]